MDLRGHLGIVTGGTGLIGTQVCETLASAGATVAVTSRSLERAKGWITDREAHNDRFIPVELDLTDEDAIRQTVIRLTEDHQAPTILVANATNTEVRSLSSDPPSLEDITKLYRVDVAGHVVLAQAILDTLRDASSQSSARIVFMSSIYGIGGVHEEIYPPGTEVNPIHYAGAKAGVIGVMRHLASRWGSEGARINVVVAGGVGAEQSQDPTFVEAYSSKTMLERMAEPQEVADAVHFLVSDKASYITGHTLIVDGGWSAW